MNRLSNYFQSVKLAKMHVVEALSQNAKGRQDNAVRHLSEALLCQGIALNNLASIAFKAKPKKRNPVKKSVITFGGSL